MCVLSLLRPLLIEHYQEKDKTTTRREGSNNTGNKLQLVVPPKTVTTFSGSLVVYKIIYRIPIASVQLAQHTYPN